MGGGGSKLRSTRVVIIGGGYGGVTLAMTLKDKCQLTMIDPKDHFFHNIGALRACVEPGFTRNIFIPYAPSLGKSFLQGRAKSVDLHGKKVTLDGGQSLAYDYLVLATGSSGPFPGKLSRVLPVTELELATEMYKLTLEKIKSAEKVIIMGGGAVGVELAGEIATDFPGKNITLIHAHKKGLIDGKRFTEKFRKDVYSQLVKLKVNVLLDERVVNKDELPKDGFGKCKVKTDARKTLDADLVFDCTGLMTNSAVYTDILDEKMDSNDRLRVNNFLQVEGQSDVYAIGDCCNADNDLNMAYNAELHAKLVATNIQLGVTGKNYKSYKPAAPQMILSIGRDHGVAQTGTRVLGMNKGKSQDMFVTKYWKLMKQVAPGKQQGHAPKRSKTVAGRPASQDPSPGKGKKAVSRTRPSSMPPSAPTQNNQGKPTTTGTAGSKNGAKGAPPKGTQAAAAKKKPAAGAGGKQKGKKK